MPGLFRPEVFNARSPLLGEVLHWRPPRLRAIILLAIAAFIALCASVLCLPYAQKVSVEGFVRAEQEPTAIVSAENGRVERLLVRDDQWVGRGDKLMRLDLRRIGEDGAAIAEVRVQELEGRIRYLDRALDNGWRVQREKLAEQAAARRAGRRQQAMLEAHREVLVRRSFLARAALQRAQRLVDEGSLSVAELHASEADWLDREQARLRHEVGIEQVAETARRAAQTIAILKSEWGMEAARVRNERREAQLALHRVRQSDVATVLATRAGWVTDLRAQEGAWVQTGSVLLSLVDRGARPGVEVRVPGSIVSRIERGARVRLRFSGYPVSDYGAGEGRVRRTSSVARFVNGQPVYRAIVDIERMPDGVFDPAHLPSGMRVFADIHLASDPLWRWLMKPMAELLARI